MLSNTQHNQENSHWQKEEREQNFAFLLWIFGFVWVFGFWGLLIIIYQTLTQFCLLGIWQRKKKPKKENPLYFL